MLVPVIDRSEPTVLLTMRTQELASHAGQVAFPGGKIDPGDESPVAAALREAREEIGLAPTLVEPLGYLDLYLTFSGFRILPTVARVKPDFTLDAQSARGHRDIRSAARVSDDAGQSPAQKPRLERRHARILRDTVRGPLHLGHHRGYRAQPLRAGLQRMIRPIATEFGLFLTPFVLYAVFLVGDARRRPAAEGVDAATRLPALSSRRSC